MHSSRRHVLPLDPELRDIGGKARGLQKLMEQGLPVPETFICSMDAYRKYKKQDLKVFEEIKEELTDIIAEEKRYIVRSSADIEDSSNHSYAGQFKTVPYVKGLDSVIDAMKIVWDSASSSHVEDYSSRKSIEHEINISAIIQEMVNPEVSGVVFTRNPLNGEDEIIVEGITGSSDQILQKGVNPDRWVYRQGRLVEKPQEPCVGEEIITEIAKKSKMLEGRLEFSLDLEWVYSDDRVWWIQLREITKRGRQNCYSNVISSEQLPGLIKPLIWSINIPLVCGAWVNLIEEMVGPTDLEPENMAKQFYYRAYYNMSALGDVFEEIGVPRDSLEAMMGYGGDKGTGVRPRPPLRLMPRIIRFMIGKTFYEGKLEAHLRESGNRIKYFEDKDVTDSFEALEAINELFQYNQRAAYFVIVSQLLHSVFHKMIRGRISKMGIRYDEVNLESNIPGIDPRHSLKELHESLKALEKENLDIQDMLEEDVFREKYQNFIDEFGHLSDSGNDFSQPTWAETPEHVLNLIQYHHSMQFDPHAPRTVGKLEKWWLYKKTVRLHGLREKISFNYVKSYGLFRRYFLLIGKDLVDNDIIDEESDIFYLTHQEIKQLVSEPTHDNKKGQIIEIKKKMEKAGSLEPPTEIFGEEEPPIINRTAYSENLTGIPASSGYYEGTIIQVKTTKDFHKVKKDDVVVIPFSDVSWSPIFSKAGAIISESGGLLSHAAVVAREYNIPAIVGVKNAFSIPDGSKVIVDGFKGSIVWAQKD
jgi:phosphoenolpyruvate synthase/pyruvate phosphate dikinase